MSNCHKALVQSIVQLKGHSQPHVLALSDEGHAPKFTCHSLFTDLLHTNIGRWRFQGFAKCRTGRSCNVYRRWTCSAQESHCTIDAFITHQEQSKSNNTYRHGIFWLANCRTAFWKIKKTQNYLGLWLQQCGLHFEQKCHEQGCTKVCPTNTIADPSSGCTKYHHSKGNQSVWYLAAKHYKHECSQPEWVWQSPVML